MPIRLISFAALVCICAAPGFAQSHVAKAPNAVVSSITNDRGAQIGMNDDSGKAQSGSRNESLQLPDAERKPSHIVRGMALQTDVTCYAIRSYLVVRDDPKSDSTRRDGSTTCVPAPRFRMFTAADETR